MKLLLASASPRRTELLTAAGFVFDVLPVDVDEMPHPGEPAEAYVVRLAIEKAAAAARCRPEAIVLGADTTVVAPDGRMLGKPSDRAEAAGWLAALGGRAHRVLTGVAVERGGRQVSAFDETVVHMRPLTPAEIDWYAASGEWQGKAGGYAIQGLASRFIERIEGSYGNVVGLPISTVTRLLRQIGADDRLISSPIADKSDNR